MWLKHSWNVTEILQRHHLDITKTSLKLHLDVSEKSQISNLPQIAGSSSEPSAQSLSPSHFQAPRIHLPLLRHLNWFSGQSWSHISSSDLSPQSSIPSQSAVVKVQFLFLHWNCPIWQTRFGQDDGSSFPFKQSFLPSHFQWAGTHLNNKMYVYYNFLKVVYQSGFLTPFPQYLI